jgi:murein DD-endopeptidase MepM/ murein hydrolase activator NlpD
MNAARHVPTAAEIELGEAPPLLTAGSRDRPDRRSVSLRWLAGTVLASFASTFLMGGALYAAFDGRETIAQPSGEVARAPVPEPSAPVDDVVAKADLPDIGAAPEPPRQILKVSTIAKDGERDVIRLKPFAKVSTALIADIGEITDPIPSYNPLRIFADANSGTSPDAEAKLYGAAVDGEMSVRVADFPVDDPTLKAEIPLDVVQTERVVREAAQFLNGTDAKLAALPPSYQSRFDFGFSEQYSFEQAGVRIIPENVSFIAPSAEELGTPERGSVFEDRKLDVAADEPLDELLTDNEATDDEAGDIVLAFHKSDRLRVLKAGDQVRLRLAPDPDDETARYRPILVSIYRGGQHLGSVGLSDDSHYITVDEPPQNEDVAAGATDENSPRPRLYESLYETALQNEIPPALIDELIRVYSFDLDFNTRIQPGDHFQVVYSMDEDGSEAGQEIVYTAITLAGKERRFYRYRAPDDGSVDYYDADGKSAKKFLLRKPMSGGTFRSGFGARNHPLLGVVKMHTGVDWAAPRGTPIMAAGDGIVTYAKWKNGYGNYIEVQHTNGYATAYAHQTAFAKGIAEGSRVRQGQIIGYVGTTGLSTGPHLHYEVHVNGTPVDPLRIKLPQGRTLDGAVLASFEGERHQVDTLLGDDPNQTAKSGSPVPPPRG